MIRKAVVFVLGGAVLAFGIALLFLPGPAFVVIPIGLGLLATEFDWAKRLLRRVRDEIRARLDRGRAGRP